MIQEVKLILPYKVSTNRIYAGIHFATRKKHKDLMRWAMLPIIREFKPIKSGHLRFNFHFRGRVLDCSNCSYMAKMIEDCLVENAIFKDDTPEYIKSVTLIATNKAKQDYCIVTIEEEESGN